MAEHAPALRAPRAPGANGPGITENLARAVDLREEDEIGAMSAHLERQDPVIWPIPARLHRPPKRPLAP